MHTSTVPGAADVGRRWCEDPRVTPDRDRERIVELLRVPSRWEAESIVALLNEHGVLATVAYGDAGGWAPHFASWQGNRVMVFESDVARAHELLGE